MKKYFLLASVIILFFLGYLFRPANIVHADKINPQSANYIMENFGFGAGGTASSSSTSYSIFGTLGEMENASGSSQNYRLGAGLIATMIASVPAAPTFTNPSNYYNKLLIKINPIINPSDFQYAVAISSDGFVTTKYVQADNTIGTNFSILSFRTFSGWGGTSGTTIIGLQQNVTYTVKVKARQGYYTESPWGPTAQASTISPTFSFSVASNNSNPQLVAIGQINPATVVTSSDKVTATVSTNGTNGAIVYLYDANTGLSSNATGHTITSGTNDLGSVSEGYGARATTVTQSSGGPMESISPYNGSGNNVGVINVNKQPIFDSTNQPVISGQGTFELRVKAANTTPASSDYGDTLTVIAAGAF